MSSTDSTPTNSRTNSSSTAADGVVPQPDTVTNGHVPDDGTIAIMAGSRSLVTQRSHKQLMRLLAASVNHSDFIPNAVVSRSNGGADSVYERWADSAGLPIARFSTPWDETDHPDAVVKQSPHGPYDARADCRRHQQMAEFAAGAGDRGVLLVLQVFDPMGNPSPETADLIMWGRAVLDDHNVFVVPLGNHPPFHVLEEAYGGVLHLPTA